MNTCPNCGKVTGLHSSILQGCMCQYSMQTPPQRTWVGLTDEESHELWESTASEDDWELMKRTEDKLKEKNT